MASIARLSKYLNRRSSYLGIDGRSSLVCHSRGLQRITRACSPGAKAMAGACVGLSLCFWPVLTRLLSVPCLGHKNHTRGAARGPNKPPNKMSQPGSPRAGPSRDPLCVVVATCARGHRHRGTCVCEPSGPSAMHTKPVFSSPRRWRTACTPPLYPSLYLRVKKPARAQSERRAAPRFHFSAQRGPAYASRSSSSPLWTARERGR